MARSAAPRSPSARPSKSASTRRRWMRTGSRSFFGLRSDCPGAKNSGLSRSVHRRRSDRRDGRQYPPASAAAPDGYRRPGIFDLSRPLSVSVPIMACHDSPPPSLPDELDDVPEQDVAQAPFAAVDLGDDLGPDA